MANRPVPAAPVTQWNWPQSTADIQLKQGQFPEDKRVLACNRFMAVPQTKQCESTDAAPQAADTNRRIERRGSFLPALFRIGIGVGADIAVRIFGRIVKTRGATMRAGLASVIIAASSLAGFAASASCPPGSPRGCIDFNAIPQISRQVVDGEKIPAASKTAPPPDEVLPYSGPTVGLVPHAVGRAAEVGYRWSIN